jgi:glycosyltransferase involved in cell wall biosynthesis
VKVTQVCIGKFHHFHLARHLAERGELAAIFSGYPWFRLKNEGVPRELVRSYPWIQTFYMAGLRYGLVSKSPAFQRKMEWRSHQSLDRYAARNLPPCEVVVGLSGSALQTGRKAQNRGGKYVCDRGSSHIRFQNRLLHEEYERWGLKFSGVGSQIMEKELAEYETADLITVPSEFNVRTFIEEGVPAERIAKVPYGANIAKFSPQGSPDPSKFVVLFVGQISLRKGIPYLLQAFEKFKHPQKELWIVGSEVRDIHPVLKQFDLSRVIFKGRLPQEALSRVYSQANAFVLPAIEEGLAMVQGEALACGCPVIGTEHTGASDLFTDGREGYIVPIRDPDTIAERLTQLADSPALRAQMSAAALTRVRSISGWGEYAMNMRNCLNSLVESTAYRVDNI